MNYGENRHGGKTWFSQCQVTGSPCLIHPAKGMNITSEYGTHSESSQVALAPPQPLSSLPIAKGTTAQEIEDIFWQGFLFPPSHFRLLLLRICVPFIVALKYRQTLWNSISQTVATATKTYKLKWFILTDTTSNRNKFNTAAGNEMHCTIRKLYFFSPWW